MSKENRSFGEYFDAQRIRIEKAMQNKNTQLHKEWREDFDKRQRELSLLRKMAPVGPKEKKLLKEMIYEQRKTG